MTTRSRTDDVDASRQQILDAAEELVLQQGLAGTSIRQVAERAGVAKSLVFYHFQSKARLAEQLRARQHERYSRELSTRLFEIEDTLESLVEAFHSYFKYLQENPRASKMLARSYMNGEGAGDALAALRQNVVAVGEAAQAQGRIRADVNVLAVVMAGIAMIEHWFEFKHVLGEQLDDDAYFRTAASVLQFGLVPVPRDPS